MSIRIAIIQTGTAASSSKTTETAALSPGLREYRDMMRTQHLGRLRELAQDGIAIAAFPEMADLPFSLMTEKDVLLDVATQLGAGEDLFFTELRDLADKSGMVIVYPTLERDGERLFSS